MPTVAEQLLGLAAEDNADLAGNFQRGAELGLKIEATRQQREQLDQQKEQHHLAKINRVMDAIEAGSQFKDKAAQNMFFKNYVPSMVKALKVDDFFSPETLGYVQESQEVRNKLIGLRLDIQDKINRGELRGRQIFDYAQSKLTPEELPLLDTDSLLEQQKFATAESGKLERVERGGQIGMEKQVQGQAAAGQVAASKGLGDEFAKFEVGKPKILSGVTALKAVAEGLKTGKVKTREMSSFAPYLSGATFQSLTNPTKEAFKNDAEQILEETLKETLGAQFTEGEGKRRLARIWDDKQDNQENARRVINYATKLERELKQKEGIFRQHGHSPAPVKSPNSAYYTPKKKAQYKDLPDAEKQKVIQRIVNETGETVDEVKAKLEN